MVREEIGKRRSGVFIVTESNLPDVAGAGVARRKCRPHRARAQNPLSATPRTA